jgi:MFS transporter, MHS family, shikimate and dehydroshikimate transport protein
VYPFFLLMATKSLPLIYLGLLVVSAGAKTMMTAAQGPWLTEMFPAQIRYTGFALAREVTSPIAGGLAPIIATALLAYDPSATLVGLYVAMLGLITAVAVWLGPETRGRDLAATAYSDPAPNLS